MSILYNVNFIKNLNKTTNTLFVFHSESSNLNIEQNIVKPIVNILESKLITKYPERSLNESLLCLRYPESGATSLCFSRFFDSPTAVAILHREFKGIFVVDASGYPSVTPEIKSLIHYIRDNSSGKFKFIILLNARIETAFYEEINTLESDEYSTVKLEVDLSVLKEFKKALDEKSYNLLEQHFLNDVTLRTQSYTHIAKVVNTYTDNIEYAIQQLQSIDKNERRIGF